MYTNGIRDLAALAADDAQAEREIDQQGGNALRLALHAYAFHNQDGLTPADLEEELLNRRALVRCLPVSVVALLVLFAVWGA
jgi:hypothetical protein